MSYDTYQLGRLWLFNSVITWRVFHYFELIRTYFLFLTFLQELSDINQMIRQGSVSKKRAFTMEGDETESPTKRLSQESEDVLLKRLQDVVTERANHWLITSHHVSPDSAGVVTPESL